MEQLTYQTIQRLPLAYLAQPFSARRRLTTSHSGLAFQTVRFKANVWDSEREHRLVANCVKSINLRNAALLFLLLFGSSVYGQTGCSIEHADPGAFICFPSLAANPGEASVPNLFHLSAQGNAWAGGKITRYVVFLDKTVAYESRLATPAQRLSIEVNVRSSFTSGFHTLTVIIDGAGTAKIEKLQFHNSTNGGFCEPVSSLPSSACTPSNSKATLSWSPVRFDDTTRDALHRRSATDQFAGYTSYRDLYVQNLKSLETDTADAMAVDSRGNLYVVFHLLAGLELRKYAPNASIVYDSVIPTCGQGLVSVSGLAVDQAGHAWIAGNTTACLATTPRAWQTHVNDTSRTHGFVILLDTSSPSSTSPRYATYLADAENEVTSIQVDSEGNAYLAGVAKSAAFPHNFTFRLTASANVGRVQKLSFVSVLNSSGSGLRWSALFNDTELMALAADSTGKLFLTGRAFAARDDLVIAALSQSGKELSYVAYLGFSGNAEGRAISITPDDKWVIISGDRDSPYDPLASSSRKFDNTPIRTFLAAVQPCTKNILFSRAESPANDAIGTEVSRGPALAAFASALHGDLAIRQATADGGVRHNSFQITPACATEIR